MDAREARIYTRLKAVCCQTWGITPTTFDAQAEAEMVALEDVLECVFLRSCEPFGVNVLGYVYREREYDKRRRLADMKRLVTLYRAETDPDRRESLKRQIEEANK